MDKKRTKADWLYVLAICAILACSVEYLLSASSVELTHAGVAALMICTFVAAFLMETAYRPWVGVLPNIFLAYLLMKYDWPLLSPPLKVYAYLGLVLGISSFVLYYKKKDNSPLSKATYLLYSLKTVFPLYFSYFVLGSFAHPYFLYSFIVFSIMNWVFYMKTGI